MRISIRRIVDEDSSWWTNLKVQIRSVEVTRHTYCLHYPGSTTLALKTFEQQLNAHLFDFKDNLDISNMLCVMPTTLRFSVLTLHCVFDRWCQQVLHTRVTLRFCLQHAVTLHERNICWHLNAYSIFNMYMSLEPPRCALETPHLKQIPRRCSISSVVMRIW